MNTGFVDFFNPSVTGLTGRTVLQIIPSLGNGGTDRIVLAVAAALANVGVRSLVACEDGSGVGELQARGGIWIPFPAKTKNPIAMALNVQKLTRLIRGEKVDLVHAHSRAPAWVALGACHRTGQPFVTTFHNSHSLGGGAKSIYNSVMTRSNAVVVHSEFTASLISRQFPTVSQRTHIIEAGVDFQDFSPGVVSAERVSHLRATWGVSKHEHVVLLPSRFLTMKAAKPVLEAARILVARGLSQTKFVLAGDGLPRTQNARDIDSFIQKHSLQATVIRAPFCKDLAASFMSAALIITADVEPDAFGLTAIEAQAVGTPPVVGSNCAAAEAILSTPDVPAQERTGWRVNLDEPLALAEVILEALSMGASAKDSLSSRARTHVTKRFGMERMTTEVLKLYAGLLR